MAVLYLLIHTCCIGIADMYSFIYNLAINIVQNYKLLAGRSPLAGFSALASHTTASWAQGDLKNLCR